MSWRDMCSDDSARCRLGEHGAFDLCMAWAVPCTTYVFEVVGDTGIMGNHPPACNTGVGGYQEADALRRSSIPQVAMAGTHYMVCTHIRGHCHRCRGWIAIGKD